MANSMHISSYPYLHVFASADRKCFASPNQTTPNRIHGFWLELCGGVARTSPSCSNSYIYQVMWNFPIKLHSEMEIQQTIEEWDGVCIRILCKDIRAPALLIYVFDWVGISFLQIIEYNRKRTLNVPFTTPSLFLGLLVCTRDCFESIVRLPSSHPSS